jgi:hypothetical protein
MNMPIPVVGSEPGPEWATDLNDCLNIVDIHDHTPGSGVQITPSGLDINTALTFNSNFATDLAGLSLIAQSGTPANNTIYESGVDLYYVDGVGNNIQITANGGVAGSPGSIANLTSPASASYVAGSSTFVWQSDVNTPANMDGGSVIIRNITASSKGITLTAPAALGSNYSITLPALPASQKIMTLDATGALTAPYTVDNSTITISANVIGVPDGGITRPKMVAVGQQVSSSSGVFTTSSSSLVDVTNLSVSLTTTGRPVMLLLIDDGTGGYVQFDRSTAAVEPGVVIAFLRAGVAISTQTYRVSLASSYTNELQMPPSIFQFFDVPAAGTYTYKVQAKITSATTVTVGNCKLVAYEL